MFADKYHWIKSNKDVNEEAADAYRVIIAMTEIIANFAKTGQVQIDLELFDFFDSQNNNIEAKQRMSHILWKKYMNFYHFSFLAINSASQ